MRLFEDGTDLCSLDDIYRNQSITFLQSVVDLTIKLSDNFSRTKPLIVVNAGGFTQDKFMKKASRGSHYELIEFFSRICHDVELFFKQCLLAAFGGKRYQNLLLNQMKC